MSNYHFFTILIFIFLIYFSSLFLVKSQKINLIQHRRFWNIILTFSFLISCTLGLVLAFSIDQKINLSWYLPFLWYHVEFGIIMSLVGIFHFIWHLPYYKTILSIKKP